MKIAIFKNISCGFSFDTILNHADVDGSVHYSKEYVQTSEWVDVSFVPLSTEVVIDAQLKGLDAAESELRNKFAEKLSQINSERQKLRSLTHEVAS